MPSGLIALDQRVKLLQALRNIFLEELAIVLTQPLNQYLRERVTDDLAERRELASTTNAWLRSLGLAIRCPRTGSPGILVVDFKNPQHPDVTRFRIEIRDAHGRTRRHYTANALPDLELIPDTPRAEPLARSEIDKRLKKER